MKQTFYQVLIILCAAIVASLLFNQTLLFNQIRPDYTKSGLPLIAKNILSQDDNKVREISIEDAYQIAKKGKTLFVDARSENDFKERHIKGSVNLDEKKFDEFIDDFLSRTDPETQIITYCDGIHCSLGKDLAEKLFSIGYDNIHYLANGLTIWEEKLTKMSDEKKTHHSP